VRHLETIGISCMLLLIGATHHTLAQEVPFNKGVNLTQWFQAPSARQVQFTQYTREDFEAIKRLGCDVIRLPINLHFMTYGAPDYEIDPLFFTFMDQVVDWAEELELHLILDNHTFNPSVATDPAIGDPLVKVWSQMARHYRDRSELLYYEVLNEPHGIGDTLWSSIQQEVINAIRAEDTRHTIIVGGANWNSYRNLQYLPEYEDDNLIYTFHFYDPFLFTHQGATWVTPSFATLANIPFPFDNEKMPALPANLLGTWVAGAYLNYSFEGRIERIHQLIDIAVQFREERGVPIYCGEMGVFIPNSIQEDRVSWYEEVRSYLDTHDIPWTMWDYHGGFGVFEGGSNGLFDHDLNVPLLEALTFNVPPQSEYILRPDSVGFPVYQDFIAQDFVESSYGEGIIDYYSQDAPEAGIHCIRWTGANRYDIIGLDIRPDKDLSQLRVEDYALDFMIRGDQPGTQIEIRLMDTNIDDPEDRPWRMGIAIDETQVAWDNRWHHLHIPLSNFTERGAWENEWFEPIGEFDWQAIDRLEFVAEYHDLSDTRIWLDQVIITNLDTAQVNDTSMFAPLPTSTPAEIQAKALTLYPNPVSDILTIDNKLTTHLDVSVRDFTGRIVREDKLFQSVAIDMSTLANGIYVVSISEDNRAIWKRKIIISR